jgi:membrane protein DedA with SNARE-associated domain
VDALDAAHPPIRRSHLGTLLALATVSYVLAFIGSSAMPRLIATHRAALLLALSSRNRHLLLAEPAGINVVAYAVIGFTRIVSASIVYFLLGRTYGDRGLAWVDREMGGVPGTVRWIQRAFDRTSAPVTMFFCGSNVVWLLAGLRRMSLRRFVALVSIGMAARLVFFWFVGKALRKPLTSVIDWIGRYQWPLTALFFGLTMVQAVRQNGVRARRTTPEAEPVDATAAPEATEPEAG